MKRIIIKIKYVVLFFIAIHAINGCDYLDVDPELGLEDKDVFETYKNFRSYFDYCYDTNGGKNKGSIHYSFPMYFDLFQFYRLAWQNTTDAADCGRLWVTQQNFKQCNLNQDLIEMVTFDTSRADNKPLAFAMFQMIRQCNLTIENINNCKNATEQELDDLLGQAYIIRGYCHFVLCRFFGGMPYIDHTLGADDEWDLPRLSNHETYVKAAEDLHVGYELVKKAGYMRRDAMPEEPGHLTGSTLIQPNGVAALALRSRALLYAASPLSNKKGEEDWQVAAVAASEALLASQEWGYAMLPVDNYSDNFYGKTATNEAIWSYSYSAKNNHANLGGMYAGPQSWYAQAAGVCPTQNFVDKFETLHGDALNSNEDRKVAIASGYYNEQNPYANRDPRLNICIVFDGSKNSYVTGQINIHYDPVKKTWPTTMISGQNTAFGIEWGSQDNATRCCSNTGYYCNKYWRGDRGDKSTSHPHLDPLVRVAELYLNYAEAVNEAYGPNGKAGSCPLTAIEAVNKVRERVGMPPVLGKYTANREVFRERIRNERCVELCYEGSHYYYDIRRWMIAPQTMTQTLYGMYVEKVPVSEQYPLGRKFERRPLPENRQSTWKDCMYYFPFPDSEAYKLRNFVNNDPWR